jgi:hypothetical protein
MQIDAIVVFINNPGRAGMTDFSYASMERYALKEHMLQP